MSKRTQYIRPLSCLMVFMLIALVLVTTLYILSYVPSGEWSPVSSTSNTHESLRTMKDQLYFTDLSASGIFNVTKLTQAISRSFMNWCRFLYSVIIIQILPFNCAALLVFGFLALTIKINNNISVIALPMGGHAPPMTQA